MLRSCLTIIGACVLAIPVAATAHRQSAPGRPPSVDAGQPDSSAVSEDDSKLTSEGVTGTYLATHKDWRIGFLTLRTDGNVMDERASHRGTWVLDGNALVLKWDGYPETRLRGHEHGSIWCHSGQKFYMVKE
jgi:hypothetical protein